MSDEGPTKRGRLLVILLFVGISAVLGVLLYYVLLGCLESVQVKNDYEENSVLAHEKYGYSTFEEWHEDEMNLDKGCGLNDISVG